jgi:hypothetical protein
MSSCAQNQSNQDEEGGGGGSSDHNDAAVAAAAVAAAGNHEAVQHFLATSQANGQASRSNGLPPQASRGMQVLATFKKNLLG